MVRQRKSRGHLHIPLTGVVTGNLSKSWSEKGYSRIAAILPLYVIKR
jgi:hypothetical protein